jgi:L-malate glycosyltransferase
LKILQLSSAQAFGGGERHLADLANALAARDHEVHAALRPHSPLVDMLSGLSSQNLTSLPLRNALDAFSARKLSHYVRDHGIQIVHAHMARDYPLAAYATRRNPGCKLIVTRHVLFPLNRLHSLTLFYAARVISVSTAVQRALTAQRLLPAKRIVVVPNGIEVRRFETDLSETDRATLRNLWQIRGDAMLVGTVGEITPLKGHEDFLHAAALILKGLPETRFLIAGMDASPGGQNLRTLKRLLAQMGLNEAVHLVGWVDDLPSLYHALDIFVSASHTESFGLAIAEAMASATPVVATETEGAREIIEGPTQGLLVPVGRTEALAAAVTDLIKDSDKRRSLGAAGRERVIKRFSLERMVDETEKIYQDVLGE